ncbi:cadherin domain-containing protein [Microvirga soli]|uniref:cadherin domain-containing protein n=1 Tax=Microvirga soli TaxID=1854496 RepID=UPI0028B076AC|nr:cadherin domain-containing protein [Microvirga soli]
MDATTGRITVGALGLPDVTQPTTVQVRVRVQDKAGTGFSHIEVVTVTVNPATTPQNKGPTSIGISSGGSVNELEAAGVTVATFAATDPDDSSGFVYSIVNPDGRFEFVGNQLKVKDGYRLDYEQLTSHTVTVKVTDKNGTGLSHTQNFTISVNDVNPEVTAGSSAHDVFYGGAAADALSGGFGNDSIYGGLGKDTLRGDAGDDKLWGGDGNDTLWGGIGKDTFIFNAKLGTSKTDRKVNFDTIKDYSVKDDSIWLENDLFKSNKALYKAIKKGVESKPLKMASKFFTVGDKAKQADDYFVYDSKKRVLYYDADGSGSKAAIEMATFTKNKALKILKASEFFFI